MYILAPVQGPSSMAVVPWFQRFIFIIFIAKGRGKINLWNQGMAVDDLWISG
jgi:hypothetical protein